MSNTGALSRLGSLFKNFKAPWAVTGPVSSPEYLTHLVTPADYRIHGPASPPMTPIIPQAESELVYNIQYFPRDKRRIAMRAAAAAKIAGEAGAEADLAASTVPAVPNQTYKWKTGYRPILEQSNNGYTL